MMRDKLEVGQVCCHILPGAIVKYVKRAARSDDDDDDSAKTVIILLLKGKPSFVKKRFFVKSFVNIFRSGYSGVNIFQG